jgi:hypothetical protein
MRLAILVSLAIPIGAVAKTSDPNVKDLKKAVNDAKETCKGDIDKLCSDVTPGQGRILDCLDSKSDQLSSSCQGSRSVLRDTASKVVDKATVAFRRDCGNDIQKYCADVPHGQGRLLNCLGKHEDGLSNSCKQFEEKLAQKVDEYWRG